MRTVLIVDDEKQFVESLLVGLSDYRDVFRVRAAGNGRRALDILKNEPVDLVITDLRMPVMDGFELLARMKSDFPDIPAMALSAYASGESGRSLSGMGMLRWLEKPVDLDLLARCILSYFENDQEAGVINGFSVGSFVQLMEMEEKSCLLEIVSPERRKGFILFESGIMCNAWCGEIKGEPAAVEMIGWEKSRIAIKKVPPKKIARRIQKSAMALIMEGMRKKDERDSGKKGTERTLKKKAANRPRSGKKPADEGKDIAIVGGILTAR